MSEKPNLTYFSPKVEKRKSTIDGRGLFARESIGVGEIVVVKGGYVLTRAQRDRVGRLLGPAEIQITDDLFIGPALNLCVLCGQMLRRSRRPPPSLAAKSKSARIVGCGGNPSYDGCSIRTPTTHWIVLYGALSHSQGQEEPRSSRWTKNP